MRPSIQDARRDISDQHKTLLFGAQATQRRAILQNDDGEGLVNRNAFNALSQFQSAIASGEIIVPPANDWKDKLIINYDNKYKSVWDIMMMIIVIYSSISSAYMLAFNIDTSSIRALDIFSTFIEVVFGIDIVLTFGTEYKDPQNLEFIRKHKKIAMRYLKSWFLIDFLAIFPFQLFSNITAFRLLRILRLPRFLRLLDGSRFDKLIGALLQNTSREKRMNYLYASKYAYKVVKLILIATVLTYLLGCLWYYIISYDGFHIDQVGFYSKYTLDGQTNVKKLILCCYFVLTTLSTVGYGDLTPQSNVERIFGIIIMILGIAMFSYIMGNFNDVLTNYDKQMGIVDKSADLQVWITSLTKFTNNQALPRELVQKIDEHFKFVWKNDRLSSLTPDDPYLKQMPKPLKYSLIRFLFDDIFSLFRGFLLTNEFRDSPFYYDLAFEMLPRKYDAKEMILKQGEPVHEIYLIKEGSVFIYFEHEGKQIGKYFGKGYFFGNYNIFKNIPAEFYYQAVKGAEHAQTTKVLAIPKANLLKILAKYPDIFARMVDNSKRNATSLKEIMKHELKTTLQKQGQDLAPNQIEDLYRECVTEKVKKHQALLKGLVKRDGDQMDASDDKSPTKLKSGANSPSKGPNGADGSAEFRKLIAKDLLDITNKLQKVRDKLVVREKNNEDR